MKNADVVEPLIANISEAGIFFIIQQATAIQTVKRTFSKQMLATCKETRPSLQNNMRTQRLLRLAQAAHQSYSTMSVSSRFLAA
jgi:hypothetical protein